MAKPVIAVGSFVEQFAVAFGAEGQPAKSVSDTEGLPTVSAAAASFGASIDQTGNTITSAIDLGAQRLFAILIPAGWTGAGLSFQASVDGAAWADLYNGSGELVIAAGAIGASRAVLVDPAAFFGIRYLKIRSGTAAAPVAQAAARALVLATVAR